MAKDSAARIELGRSFHQMGTVNAGADLTNRRGKRPLRAQGNQGALSDICETYLANALVCICVMESVKCSLTTQNNEFLSGAEFCKLVNSLIITTCR